VADPFAGQKAGDEDDLVLAREASASL